MVERSLRISPQQQDPDGLLLAITPQQAGWQDLGFAAYRLRPGQRLAGESGSCELALVLLSGRATINTEARLWSSIGGRATVFEGLPYALYLPPGMAYDVLAETELELTLAWCSAQPGGEARLVTPEQVAVEVRGGGNATRQINHIMPEDFPAQRLLVVEVYTPPGNWSSYPPHKHDVHDPPHEVQLEEIYYYKIAPSEGYAIQQIYSPERGLDQLLRARDGDLVLVPYGYHPVVAPPGYAVYYLNALAGSAHAMSASDDPHYAWVRERWPAPDPRVPLVQ